MDDARQAYLVAEQEQWLTPHECAVVWRVSVAHVRRLLREGQLPYLGIGRQRRIHKDALRNLTITTKKEVRHDHQTNNVQPQPIPDQLAPRTFHSQTARRLRAFDGGRPRRTATGA